jgi:phage-related protein
MITFADVMDDLLLQFEGRAGDAGREGVGRSVFCTVKGKEIVILITVVKKGNRIPKRHMETARKRMKELQDG